MYPNIHPWTPTPTNTGQGHSANNVLAVPTEALSVETAVERVVISFWRLVLSVFICPILVLISDTRELLIKPSAVERAVISFWRLVLSVFICPILVLISDTRELFINNSAFVARLISLDNTEFSAFTEELRAPRCTLSCEPKPIDNYSVQCTVYSDGQPFNNNNDKINQ